MAANVAARVTQIALQMSDLFRLIDWDRLPGARSRTSNTITREMKRLQKSG
jgi:hypothetical protein